MGGHGRATAQVWNGALRWDYQNAGVRGTEGGRMGVLTQRYSLRYYGRLFYKNDLLFTSDLSYRTGSNGQPVDFRPRYEWLLSGYGYGWRLAYEPFTIRQSGGGDGERVRRWRSSVFVQPNRWPRLTYDFLLGRQDKPGQGIGRDRWNSYSLTWQPAGVALAAGYSRQVRSSRDTTAQMLEVYRLSLSVDRTLPWRHRLNVGYSFDRNWDHRPSTGTGQQDQHVPMASISGQPARTVSWAAQYSSRFLHRRSTRADENVRTNDRLASGSVTVVPWRPLSVVLSRYVEDSEERQDQPGRRTDYWQGRVSAEGRLYRQMRLQTSVYRLYYMGAPAGARYNDAYFMALRGRPQRHFEWSSELALSDRHGTQLERFSANLNTYARLYPTAQTQCQLGYTSLATAVAWEQFRAAEENITGNLQYTPDENLSLTGGVTWGRNRRVDRGWETGWTGAGTYRWPSFATIGFNYSRRAAVPVWGSSPIDGDQRTAETILVDLLLWLGPRTTATASYTHRRGGRADSGSIWGCGLSTQF